MSAAFDGLTWIPLLAAASRPVRKFVHDGIRSSNARSAARAGCGSEPSATATSAARHAAASTRPRTGDAGAVLALSISAGEVLEPTEPLGYGRSDLA
jgi:hypothetical protein